MLKWATDWQHRLRCASKVDKEAGILKRARERESCMANLETDRMIHEDEVRGPSPSAEPFFCRIQVSDRFGYCR